MNNYHFSVISLSSQSNARKSYTVRLFLYNRKSVLEKILPWKKKKKKIVYIRESRLLIYKS